MGRASSSSSKACPPACPSRRSRSRSSWRRRRLGFGRGPRMRFEEDRLTLIGGVRHGRTLGSPIAIEIANTEWPKWEQEMSPAPGRDREAAHPAPARSRRPPRDAEVRLRRRPGRPRAGLRPGDGSPGGGRRGRQGIPGRARHRHRQPHRPDGPGGRQVDEPADGRRPGPRRRVAGALLRPGGRGRHGGRGQGRGQGGRLPGRRGRGHRLRHPGRTGQPRPLGPPAGGPAGSGPDEHPGRQRGGDRRCPATSPGGGAPTPTTPSRGTATTASLRAGDQLDGRYRGRDLQRPARRRPGGHEAARHPQPSGPAGRWTW